MKYRIGLILLLLLVTLSVRAQKDLEFYYIAHNQDEVSLSVMLDDVRKVARYNSGLKVVYYLANGSSPLYHVVSPDDGDEYDAFRHELNSRSSHTVYPEVDRKAIIDMFSGGYPLKTVGFDSYNKVTFNFCVTSSFFNMGWGDGLIGRLFWEMEMDKLPKGKIAFNIYYPADEKDQVNENNIFGRLRLFGDYDPLINDNL